MSIQTLQLELDGRAGRELLPNFFPIDLLIGMTRELALVADCALSREELRHMTTLMKGYLRRVVEMQGVERLTDFDGEVDEMITPLAGELYDCLFEEIVSRLIGYDVRSTTLQDRFVTVLDGVQGSAGRRMAKGPSPESVIAPSTVL